MCIRDRAQGQEQQDNGHILNVESDGPPGGHFPRVLNASGGGGLAEFLRCLGRPHEHGDIDALQFFLQAVDLAQSHSVPDMPEVLAERRQKPEGHRQRDGNAPGCSQPFQSGHELADTGSGKDVYKRQGDYLLCRPELFGISILYPAPIKVLM